MLASTAPGRRVPNPFSAVTSAAVSACMSVRLSSRGSLIRGAAATVAVAAAPVTRAARPSRHARSADSATMAIALVWS